jgi:ribosomal protein S18 acetylase RimI-like enzyme
VIVRKIEPRDKADILRLAKLFFDERLSRDGVTFCPSSAEANFDMFVTNPAIVALCAEEDGVVVGMIAGFFSRMFFAKELALQELVWYVEPRKRKCGIRLLKEFERAGQALGADVLLMVGMSGDTSIDFYRRMGYAPLQETFLKKVG